MEYQIVVIAGIFERFIRGGVEVFVDRKIVRNFIFEVIIGKCDDGERLEEISDRQLLGWLEYLSSHTFIDLVYYSLSFCFPSGR